MSPVVERSTLPGTEILLISGEDVWATDPLWSFLGSATPSDSPVRRGTHDFLFTYWSPDIGTGAPNHWGAEELDRPRPLRGFVYLKDPPTTHDEGTLRDRVSTLIHETAHHWLVPSAMTFTVDGRALSMTTLAALTTQLREERPFTGPTVLGRDDSHWTPYLNAGGSIMEAFRWAPTHPTVEDGYEVFAAMGGTRRMLTSPVPGLPDIDVGDPFNDLDEFIMGTRSAADSFTADGGMFSWFEPRLGAPFNYHAGVFLGFDRYDFITFGFFTDPHTLAVERTADRSGRVEVDISAFRPLANERNMVGLRVVRRGRRCYFQARLVDWTDMSAQIMLGRDRSGARHPFAGIERPIPEPDGSAVSADRFTTVAALDVDAAPRAVGVIARNWADDWGTAPFLVDAAFVFLGVDAGGGERWLGTSGTWSRHIPPSEYDWTRSDFPPTEPMLHLPSSFAVAGPRSSRFHFILPFNRLFPHWRFPRGTSGGFLGADLAPKVICRAPAGDFAVYTTAKVHRALLAPGAGGYTLGKKLWVHKRPVPISGVELPDEYARWKQPPPPGNTYKGAFVIVGERREEITADMIRNTDYVRQYFERAFARVTGNRRRFDTRL